MARRLEGTGDTHVLLHVLLAMLESRLPKLSRDLRRRVIHELPICPKDIPARPPLLLVGVGPSGPSSTRETLLL